MRASVTILFVCFFSQLFSQDYVPFPTDSAAWAEEFAFADNGEIYNEGRRFHYLLGDTIINGIEYSKVFQTEDYIFMGFNPWPNELMTFLREEDKRILLVNPGDSCERVLYDFNLSIGDTLKYRPPGSDCSGFSYGPILLNIDTIQILNNQLRRAQYLSNGAYVIEGIGSIYGGLLDPGSHLDFYANLLCFTTIDSLFYSWVDNDAQYNSVEECLELYISLDIKETMNRSIAHLFPNPSSGSFQIQFGRMFEMITIHVYSDLGELIQKENFGHTDKIRTEIISDPGMYFVKIFGDDNYITTKRLIKR